MDKADIEEVIQSITNAKKNYCGGYTSSGDEELYEAYVHGMDTILNMYKYRLKAQNKPAAAQGEG